MGGGVCQMTSEYMRRFQCYSTQKFYGGGGSFYGGGGAGGYIAII